VSVALLDNFLFFAFNFFDFTHDDNLVFVSVTLELFIHLIETFDGCLHPTLMAVSHIIDLDFLSLRGNFRPAVERTLELLLHGAVGDAVRLEDKSRAIKQVAVTRLFWEVGGVAGV